MKLRNVVSGFVATALSFSTVKAAEQAATENVGRMPRPPQFILLSFDGSKSIPFWKETRAFAKKYGVGFTYFMSGVYFLSGQEKHLYRDPRKTEAPIPTGKSDIGFGVDHEDISTRVDQVLDARREGLEMGSHANGHYDGTRWSFTQWVLELSEFKNFIEDVFSINSFPRARESDWKNQVVDTIRGFRAPLLGVNKDMYRALKDSGYTYDTSGIGDSRRWPYKKDGLWMFPLQSIRLAGTGKLTVTMDYNILVSQCNNQFADGGQSACKENSAEKLKLYEDETYETYVNLFKKNYFSNRAPLVIGHHFSLWNKGAYWKAMQRFAADVCNIEEVRCVTYQEMVQWLENQKSAKRFDVLASFQQGLFPAMPQKDLKLVTLNLATFNLDANLSMKEQGKIEAQIIGRDARKLNQHGDISYEWKVDGETRAISRGKPEPLTLDDSEDLDGKMVTLSIKKSDGKELIGAVRTLRKNGGDDEKIWLQNTGWSERLLRGDLPEAHSEIVDEEMLEQSRIK